MKSISSPPLFQLPRGGRYRLVDGAGSVTGLYGTIGCSSCRSVKILAKKSKNNPKQPPSTGSNEPPPRITSNLKHNLPILKVLKESEKKKSTPLLPSRYRRKRVDKKEPELNDDPPTTLDSMDSDIEENEEAPKVLFVDGYNVCGYWPKLKTEFMSGKLDTARRMLIKDMMIFSGMNEMEVVVVFDALKSGHCTRREEYAGVGVVYSGETSADLWIDQEVKRVMEDERADVTVATSDRAMMNEAYFKGASVWSCATLVSEGSTKIVIDDKAYIINESDLANMRVQIEDAYKEIEIENQRSSILSKHGSLLKNVLRPGVLDGLKDLRKKLLFQEMERRSQISRAKSMDSLKNNRRPKIRVSPSRVHAMRREARLQYELHLKAGGKIPTEPGEFRIEDISS